MSARPPTRSRPTPSSPSTRAGTAEAAASARSSGHAGLDEVPDRLDHRQRAAREHAVAAAGDAVEHVDVDGAER